MLETELNSSSHVRDSTNGYGSWKLVTVAMGGEERVCMLAAKRTARMKEESGRQKTHDELHFYIGLR
jgi:hypothetical protein